MKIFVLDCETCKQGRPSFVILRGKKGVLNVCGGEGKNTLPGPNLGSLCL